MSSKGKGLTAWLALEPTAQCGESPLWHNTQQALFWIDLFVGDVHRTTLAEDDWTDQVVHSAGEPLAAALPCLRGGIAMVTSSRILHLDDSGVVTTISEVELDTSTLRINDAKCDPAGRIWASTVSHDLSVGRATLLRLDPDGTTHRMLEGVTMGNGLDWSPDGRTMYFADSPVGRIYAFNYDARTGAIGNRRTLHTLGVGQGWPDGLCVDAEGCVWVACALAGCVRRIAPTGELLDTLSVSAPFVTSCAFAGPDLKTLVVTSGGLPMPAHFVAAAGFPDELSTWCAQAPGAGGLFACRPGPTGLPAYAFAG